MYLWLRSTELQMMFFALAFLPILSYILAWLSRRNLEVVQDIECTAVPKGTAAGFWIELTNRGRMPVPYIRLCWDEQPLLRYTAAAGLYSLAAGEKRRVKAEACAPYRGRYPIGAASVWIEDYLRLFRLPCQQPPRPEITFLPALQPITAPPSLCGASDSRAPVPGAVEDYSSVAEIVPYDPSREFRKIHWKLTARLDELMVRQFETEDSARATLLLDITSLGEGEQGAALADAMAEGAASLLSVLMRDDRPIGLLYGLDRPVLLQNSGREGFENYYKLIGGLPFAGELDAAALLSYYLETRTAGAALLFTAQADDRLLSAVSAALSAGVQVALFALETGDEAAAAQLAALEERGVPVIRFGLRRALYLALGPDGQGVA